MIDVVGVRFKRTGKIYYFDPTTTSPNVGDSVIVETIRGLELGKVVLLKQIDEQTLISELRPVIRIATIEDESKHIDNRNMAKEALIICEKQCEKHEIKMNLIGCEYTFDNSKLIFYFTADGRVDFRNLVRDLAAIFRTRIELRQVGVRDEAKVVGGLGCCGRACCCSTFLSEFMPVTIKMAKDQELSLNPTKISGICGRLMCCLKYEQDGYECILKKLPQVGEVVETDNGRGTVVGTYTIQELVKIAFVDENDETTYELYNVDEIKRTKKFAKGFCSSCANHNKEEDADMNELLALEGE